MRPSLKPFSPRPFFSSGLLLTAVVVLSLAAKAEVDVNLASQSELEEVNGIGPATAKKIIEYREQNGPFASPGDVARVPGVSKKALSALSGGDTSGQSSSRARPQLASGKPVTQETIEQVMRHFDYEPSAREVQKQAIDYANAHPDIVSSMNWRARTAAVLPQFRVRPWTYIDRDISSRVDGDAGDAPVVTTNDDNSYRMELRAQWQLDELIFNAAEPRIWSESVRLTNLRDRVVNEATRRYFERRKLQIEMKLRPATDLTTRIRQDLRLQELTADLDAMTGGWFSEQSER